MTAREKFHLGQRVCTTKKFRETFPTSQCVLGTVTGFGRSGVSIRVHPDNLKGVSLYHMDFWEPAE